MKERNLGIDVLKFLAVLLITNSHMDVLYGKYAFMATGGTIGDVLFFFCSGFTLYMKPMVSARDFPNWYKRRINRIYPTVFAVAIIFCTFFGVHSDINHIILHGGKWFITCIMIYYVFIYFIGLYLRDKIFGVLGIVALASCVWFFSVDRVFPYNMYESGYLKWLLYFNFMLLGAKLGGGRVPDNSSSWKNLFLAIAAIVLFYVFYLVGMKVEKLEWLEVLNFIPLLFAVCYLYQWSNGSMARALCRNRAVYSVVRFVGGLCLEVYLVQDVFFTDRFNHLFPLNILFIFCIILVAAYLTRCLARLISQTFKESPYDWRQMIRLYP